MPDHLPIDDQIPEALRLLEGHRNLVVQAPPGAGKTTRLPPALLDHGLVKPGREVLVLEPRRIAARMAATRVANERGVQLGGEVGYRVRFEHATSSSTRLCFVTEGILVRRLQSEPELTGVSAVIFDEFHERSLEADLSLALLREVQETIRPDLRLIVMSATLDPAPIARYLGGCPVLISEGRVYPIQIEYAGRDHHGHPPEARAATALASLLDGALSGSVLIFMPGAAEIRRTMHEIEPIARRHQLDVMPLHGDLPPEAQQAAVMGGARRRVIVSTNLAEASITVDGVEAVIDSGLVRVVRFDPDRGLNRMVTERISRSSAVQRAGRAGRLMPGRCLRLYSESDFEAMEESDEPEVRRVDLSEALLQILAWGTRDPRTFGWLTPPEPAALERAAKLLRELGAVDAPVDGSPPVVTPLGREMIRIPVHPRQAKILIEARRRGCEAEAVILVALLAERDIRTRGIGFGERVNPPTAETHAPSDLLVLAESLDTARRLHFDPVQTAAIGLDGRAARRCARVAEHLRHLGTSSSRDVAVASPSPLPWAASLEEDLLRCVAAGYPDRIVRRRAPGSREGLMVGGMGTRLDPGSAVASEELYIAVDAVPAQDFRGRYVLVRTASGVIASWLPELFPALMHVRDEVRFEEGPDRVVARRTTLFQDLSLEEKEIGTPDPDLAGQALYEAACRWPERAIEMTRDLEDLLARLLWLAERRPELELPARPAPSGLVDPLVLAALQPLCRDRRSFADLRKAPLADSLHSLLSWDTRRLLEAEAPGKLRLPSGREAHLLYKPGEAPVVAGRIQEFFGSETTPRLGGGAGGRERSRLVLHLLAPSQRPVQVTSDLASFWKNVYPKLRIELRRRYPKHSWPEDPIAASPEARPKRKPGA